MIRKHPEVIPDKYTPEYFIRMKEICDAAEYDEDLADVEWSEDDEELVGDDEVVNDITETWCSEELETILVKPNYEVIKLEVSEEESENIHPTLVSEDTAVESRKRKNSSVKSSIPKKIKRKLV